MNFMSWTAHCSKSLAMASHVFCLAVSSFGINFTVTHFMPKSSVNLNCTKHKESPNSSQSSLIVILWLSSMEKTHLVNHQLVPACGGPPWMFITLDWCPSSFAPPKALLNLCTVHCLVPKSLLNQGTNLSCPCLHHCDYRSWGSSKQEIFGTTWY